MLKKLTLCAYVAAMMVMLQSTKTIASEDMERYLNEGLANYTGMEVSEEPKEPDWYYDHLSLICSGKFTIVKSSELSEDQKIYCLEKELEYGGINATTKKKRTVLHLAAKRKLENVVRLLVNRGINIKAVDQIGKTAYDLAIEKKHDKITAYLALVADFNNVENNQMQFNDFATKHFDIQDKEQAEQNYSDALRRAIVHGSSFKFIKNLYKQNRVKLAKSLCYVPTFNWWLTVPHEKEGSPGIDFYRCLLHNIVIEVKNLELVQSILTAQPMLIDEIVQNKIPGRFFPSDFNYKKELQDPFIKLIKTKQALMGVVWLGKKQFSEIQKPDEYKRDIVTDVDYMDEPARIPLDVVNRIVRFVPYQVSN